MRPAAVSQDVVSTCGNRAGISANVAAPVTKSPKRCTATAQPQSKAVSGAQAHQHDDASKENMLSRPVYPETEDETQKRHDKTTAVLRPRRKILGELSLAEIQARSTYVRAADVENAEADNVVEERVRLHDRQSAAPSLRSHRKELFDAARTARQTMSRNNGKNSSSSSSNKRGSSLDERKRSMQSQRKRLPDVKRPSRPAQQAERFCLR